MSCTGARTASSIRGATPSSLPDSEAAVHALTLGLGNGLTATLVGVVCSVIVWVMFLHLQHAIDKPRR